MVCKLTTLRHILILTNILAICMARGIFISLLPPFYPPEALKRGATPTQYGFVFGISNLPIVLFSHIFGKYGNCAKICFITGSLLGGISGFVFGFLTEINDADSFIGLSYFLRFLEGVGGAMAWSSGIGILIKIFPNNIARTLSWTESSWSMGYLIGPAIGAGLYEAGGFMFPFFFIGTLIIMTSLPLICVIPNGNTIPTESQNDESMLLVKCESNENLDRNKQLKSHCDPDNGSQETSLGIWTIFSSRELIFCLSDIFSAECGIGMLESMLGPHMTKTGASTLEIGMSFLALGCCHCIGNILVGWAIDKVGYPTHFSLAGEVMFMMASTFVGPLSFIPMEPTKHLIQCMMALVGLAHSTIACSSFVRVHKQVLRMGFTDDIRTYVMISGTWTSFFALGLMVGSTLSGFIVDLVGFRCTTIFFFFLYSTLAIFNTISCMLS